MRSRRRELFGSPAMTHELRTSSAFAMVRAMDRRVRTTLQDVAREAGVSLATADRVLNSRPGVREGTAGRVHVAMARLGYRPDPLAARLARRADYRFAALLPSSNNAFMRALDDELVATAEWLSQERASIERMFVDVFDPESLSAALDGLAGRYDGGVVVALDHPRVRDSIDLLTEGGMTVVTLVSDVPSSRRLRFVGIDNCAAGRTAATLMGRFASGRSGPVGVILGSLSLRDHAERHHGFSQVLSTDYPALAALQPLEGRDDPDRSRRATETLLARHRNLVGIYSAGAGNEGIAEALEAAGRMHEVVVIGHELTPATRRMVMRGTLDGLIVQDPGHEARSAARILLAAAMGQPVRADQERVRIEIFVRDNLP
jgi:LacI family transcriptional regulator